MSSPISGFTAVPNPQMLAFMATQSFLMMQMAGAGWQYGKRKISAMKNEEFNILTLQNLLKSETADVRAAIPTIIQSINDMTPLVGEIVAQYGDFIREIIKATPKLVSNIYQPSQKPSVETFNPLSILNPLLPAFAEDYQQPYQSDILKSLGTSTSSDEIRSRNLRLVIRNINKSKNLNVLRNINLAQYGFTPSQFAQASRALIARMALLNLHVKKVYKSLPPSKNIHKKTRVSKQTLRIQRTKLVKTIQSIKSTLSAPNLKNPQSTGNVRHAAKVKRQLKAAQQELSNFLDRWKGIKY